MPRTAPPVVYRQDTGLVRNKKAQTAAQKEARELMTIERNRKSAAESRTRQKRRDQETRDHMARQTRLVARLSDALNQNASEFIRYRGLENDWERQQFVDNTVNIRELLAEARYNNSLKNVSPYTPAIGNMASSPQIRSSSNSSMQTGVGWSLFPCGDMEQDSVDRLSTGISTIHPNASEARMTPRGVFPADGPDSGFDPIRQAFPPPASEPIFGYEQSIHQAFQDDMQTTNVGPATSPSGSTLYNGHLVGTTNSGSGQITYQPFQSTTQTMSTTMSTATHFNSIVYASPNHAYAATVRPGEGYSAMLSNENDGVEDLVAPPMGETQPSSHTQLYDWNGAFVLPSAPCMNETNVSQLDKYAGDVLIGE